MNTIAWLSDTHLDMVDSSWFDTLCKELQDSDACAIWLTGDIAASADVCDWLVRIHHQVQLPVYFVLGNHDYYGSSFAKVDQAILKMVTEYEGITWMDTQDSVVLDEENTLVGVGGWGDARSGDFHNTPIRINDHRLIQDLSNIPRQEVYNRLLERGTMMANRLSKQLSTCVDSQNIWVLTHVPPFEEACWYQGKAGNPHWTADFVCVAVGEVLERFAQENPDKNIQVLCGHGHNRGIVRKQKNLLVYTAAAEYRKPRVEAYWSL